MKPARLALITAVALAACGDDPSGAPIDTASSSDGASSSTAPGPSTTTPSSTTEDPQSDDTDLDGCSMPDADGDAHDATECGGDDCDDDDALVHPSVLHDGWEQLSLHPFGGGGFWRHHDWFVGPDGLVDLFFDFNGMLLHVEQQDDVVWGGGAQIGLGGEPSTAMAPDGSYHMIYVGRTADMMGRGIFYMPVASAVPQTLEQLPLENPNPFGLDLAIDPDTGAMHAVFGVLYEFPPTLRYAFSEDGSAWTVETIHADAAGFGGTIVLGDTGIPQVSFSNNEDQVMLARRENGSWSTEVVATGYETVATTLARDPAGELHIAFAVSGLEDADDGLHYVRTEGGVWGEPEEVDAEAVWHDEIGAWDYRAALAVDATAVHIAYHDYGTGAFRYAARIDGAWTKRVIDDGQGEFSTQAGWDPQLVLRDDGLHIGYSSMASNDHRHLVVVPDDGRDNDCDGMIDEGP